MGLPYGKVALITGAGGGLGPTMALPKPVLPVHAHLSREGVKYGITVNVLAPASWSRMTENLLPENAADKFSRDRVSPVVAWLCSDQAKDVTGCQFCVGANRVSMLSWYVDVLAE